LFDLNDPCFVPVNPETCDPIIEEGHAVVPRSGQWRRSFCAGKAGGPKYEPPVQRVRLPTCTGCRLIMPPLVRLNRQHTGRSNNYWRQEMEEDLVQRIKSSSTYKKLVSTRSRFSWTLAAMMLVVYYGYILLIAFDKDLLSRKIGDGVMTWGIPIGLFVIIFTVLITGIYVRRANSEFDDLTAKIRSEVL
jgi:uncharacterized membrane protein (DUF485 family)